MIIDLTFMILITVSATVFFWAFYNLPILAAGVKGLLKNRGKHETQITSSEFLPTCTIIVPVKNEEKVVNRLLVSLSKLNYPDTKKEVVVVEDGSTDRTLEICLAHAKKNPNVRVLHRDSSNGKASALNYGLKHSKSAIIAVFDADSVPDLNVLRNMCTYFNDPNVAGVQGKTLSINSKQNMLTQFISYEGAVYNEVYLRGKDILNLFVHLTGSCQFIRRDILIKLEGFDEKVLSEDIELSARLTKNNYKIRYASDVIAWQESPSKVKTLFKQRTRWYRGVTEIAFRYGTLMGKLNRKNLDAEVTLFAPFILIASLLPYLITGYTFFTIIPFDLFWNYAVQFATLVTTFSLLLCGLSLVYVTKPRKIKNALWLPFVYFYWSFQAFVALYAIMLMALRRPKIWTRTARSGVVDDSSTCPLNSTENVVVSEEIVRC